MVKASTTTGLLALATLLATLAASPSAASPGHATPLAAPATAPSAASPDHDDSRESEATLKVTVPVAPYSWVVQRIAGARASITTLVASGQSPHSYSPDPQQIATLTKSDVLFRAGLELESGLVPRLSDLQPDLLVVDLASAPRPDAPAAAHDGEHGLHVAGGEHAHGAHTHRDGHDPHAWLDPMALLDQASIIAETLSQLDPAGASRYAAGLDSLAGTLTALDGELTKTLGPFEGTRFYVFHPAFGHFAEAYGLTQVAVEFEGKEPSARRLAQLVEQARADGATLIIVQPQFSDAAARTLARELDAELLAIDPLAPDPTETLRELAAAVIESATERTP